MENPQVSDQFPEVDEDFGQAARWLEIRRQAAQAAEHSVNYLHVVGVALGGLALAATCAYIGHRTLASH
jgi:hypothetical protein